MMAATSRVPSPCPTGLRNHEHVREVGQGDPVGDGPGEPGHGAGPVLVGPDHPPGGVQLRHDVLP
jgi:hypothetical protein